MSCDRTPDQAHASRGFCFPGDHADSQNIPKLWDTRPPVQEPLSRVCQDKHLHGPNRTPAPHGHQTTHIPDQMTEPGHTPPNGVKMAKTPRNTTLRNRHRATIRAQRPNCHICGGPINWEAHRDEPDSYVVDHIVPLSKGGPDTLQNKAAAHRACNSKKRSRLVAPIVRRSGALD